MSLLPNFLRGGGRICVGVDKCLHIKGPTGRAVCYGTEPSMSAPVLVAVPVLSGASIGGPMLFDLSPYQVAGNVGTLQGANWSAPHTA